MNSILYEEKNNIGILTINRPEALNALNSALVQDLTEKLSGLAQTDLRCLIITGAGEKAFVAGADIGEMANLGEEEAAAFSRNGIEAFDLIETFPAPVIAAVNGYCLGGGLELALACDIRIASEKAQFALPEVSLGVFPGYMGVTRLISAVGLARAKELAFTGRRIKADEALAIGLVQQTAAQETLMGIVQELAEKIAANAPLGVRAVKQVALESAVLNRRDLRKYAENKFGACFTTADQKEAMLAFVEKRKPAPFIGK
jgi:enoyl-CoA hydratase